MPRAVFDDTTPLEMHLALVDKAEAMSQSQVTHLDLLRHHAVIQRNKGLQDRHQVKRSQKFYELPWERNSKQEVEIPDWKTLDDKYK